MKRIKCECSFIGAERLMSFLGLTKKDCFVIVEKFATPPLYKVVFYNDVKRPSLIEFEGNDVVYYNNFGRMLK